MTTLPDINLLTGRQIEDVLKTCDSYLGKKLGLEGAVENTKLPVVVSSLNITWNSIENFEKDINLLAKENNIRSAYTKLYETWERRLVQEKSEKVEKTTLTPEEAKKLEAEAEKRKTEAKESTEKAQKKQEQWLKLQKEKVLKQVSKEEQEKVLEELKGKVIYATPQKPEPEIILTKEEEKFAGLAKRNPRVFEQKLAEDIIKKNPDIFKSEELKPLADIIASDTTNVFIDPSQRPVPTGVFAALTKYDKSPEVQKTAAIYTTLSEERQNLYREILNRTIGENLANKVLGFPETVYEFSETPPEKPEGSFSLKLDEIQANSFSLQDGTLSNVFNNPIFSEAKNGVSLQLKEAAFSKTASLPKAGFLGRISQFTTSRSFDSIAPFLGLPTQMAYTGTTFFGKMVTTFLPQYAPLITNFTAKLGIDIGIKALAPVATTAIEAGVTTAGGVAVKTGLAATLSTTLSAFGSWAPVVGNIIGAVVGWLAGKAIEPILNWIKKHQEDLKIVGLAMLGWGIIMNSLPFIIVGGLVFGSIALKTGLSMAGIAARTTFLFGRIGASLAITIGTPIIVAIVVFPILVAIILFIINSGAYIVPPRIGYGPGPGSISCSQAIADRAKAIVDNLQPGFWGFFNKSPDYPDLFDETLFEQNPDLIGIDTHKVFVNMFWCTWLVVKSYSENGFPVSDDLLFMTNLVNFFRGEGHYIDASTITIQDVCPGMAVFFNVSGSSSPNHVGIVYSVSSDGFTTVESNAPWKTMFYPVDGSGHFQIVGSGSSTIEVSGFGTP